jgi:gamma-glutamylcyclotransferase
MEIFAYGALMSATYMKKIGVHPSERMGGYVDGYKLVFEKKALDSSKKGYATIRPAANERVYGILYAVSEKDIAILDQIEHYPTGYTREPVSVTLRSDEIVPAIAYIATPEMLQQNLKPSKEYMRLICESDDLLPKEYIERMQTVKTLEELDK